MTVVNETQPAWRLPKGTIFAAPDGAQFASAFAMTIPARRTAVGATGQPTVIASQQNVWVDAVRKGKRLAHAAVDGTVQGPARPAGQPAAVRRRHADDAAEAEFPGHQRRLHLQHDDSSFVKVNSMNYARWYPTLAEMGNGMVMTMSGLDKRPDHDEQRDVQPRDQHLDPGPGRGFPTYPATFLTENGQLFFTGSNAGYGPATPAWRTPGFWNIKTDKFKPVPGIPDPQNLETSASVLLPPAQKQTFMVLGGGGVGQSNLAPPHRADRHRRPQPALGARPEPGRADPLPHHGAAARRRGAGDRRVQYYRGMHGSDNRDTRIYHVATNSFSWAANPITGRDYHSGGILLPNGSVLTLGGNPLFGNEQDTTPQTFNQEIDVYYPPYLFQGPRPRIVAAPNVMELRHSYIIKVSQPSNIKYLRLLRPDNPTHVTDVNARSVAVTFTQAGRVICGSPCRRTTTWCRRATTCCSRSTAAGSRRPAYWVRVP